MSTVPIAPFHNRDRERAALDRAIRSPRSELLILYGRRGVGKSALLRQALARSGAPYLFYRAVRRTLPLQLDALTEAFRAAFPGVFAPQPFASTTVFLEALAYEAEARSRRGEDAPVCAVIDELPYLADADPGFLTTLQHWWDDNKRRPNLKLFLAGSYLSFMERQVLDERAPLYNRRTGAMRLEPMDYAEAALFFPAYAPRERMAAYAMLGGMPSYLEQFDPALSLRENALATILRPHTYLSEEPDWLLLEDLRRDVVYGSILRAVSQGARKPSDIARAIGRNSAQDVGQHLATLQDLAVVAREIPVTERRAAAARPSRNSLYFLADHYLAFWHRFVDPARSLVAQGLGEQVWDRQIAPAFDEYVSRPAFEWACRQYLWRALRAGVLPPDLAFTDVGSWWGAGDVEIDVMALDADGAVTAAGSCKWTGQPVDVREYAALRAGLERAVAAAGSAASPGRDPHLFLFSRSGFSERLRGVADGRAAGPGAGRLHLIDLDALYAV